MIRIVFARVQEDRSALQQWLLRAAQDLVRSGKRVVILVRDAAMAGRVDEQLWVADDESFLPHAVESAGLSGITPCLIRTGHQIPAGCDVAMNLSDKAAEWPEAWGGVVCDLVWTVNPQQVEEGRAKWASYKARPEAHVEVRQSLDFSLDGVS